VKKKVTNVAKRSIEKHKIKRLLCESKREFKDNIKVDITEIGCGEL
jgi:hypothetical protein